MFICQYCTSERKNKNSLKQHEIRCKKNPDKIVVKPSYGMLGKTGSNQYVKGAVMSDETKKKISDASKQQVWTEERRKKHSETMKDVIKNNPDSYTKNNVCGRVKIIEYNGVKLKGNWEVITAKWLDSQNIKWENESNPQPYYWNEGWHLYFPDFYLPEHDIYIEVKGYKTDRDEAKWSSFPYKLIVIDLKNIKILNDISIHDLMPL